MSERDDEALEIEAIRRAVNQARPVYMTADGDITIGNQEGQGTKIKEGTFHRV